MTTGISDAGFRRLAQLTETFDSAVEQLARDFRSKTLWGDDLHAAVRDIAQRFGVEEFEVRGLMGEFQASLAEEEDAMDTVRELEMRPYTFNPDLYTKDADVGGQTHLRPYSNDEKNIGDFGPNTDQMSDQAQGAQSDVRADGAADETKYQQPHYLENPPWETPHRDTYDKPTDGEYPFPGGIEVEDADK